jgi:CubicO group peptidase (beta-lactamase class C family)
MADLEHDVASTAATIYEAGSVTKQFTAAAIQLLAAQGKLSLDDEVRKYIPELPDYGVPLTIRHMMTHTSGLRDWGSVAGIAGWPRTTRAHTHAHVLDIVSRQRALNFTPGSEHSYSNTGYNLQAVIVERVSGMSLGEFTRQHLFQPLGMTSTQWRDDYTRIVKGRSIAYAARREGGFSTDMPFEDVHGNGGLLTTVGDLLIWNQNLETGKVGGPAFLQAMQRQMRLNNGREIAYASGLYVSQRNGVREVYHTGSTAGYRAFLARYPDQRLSVALLCNIGSVNPGGVGRQLADVFLPQPVRAQQPEPPRRVAVPVAELNAKAGLYRDARTGEPMRLAVENGALRIGNAELIPVGRSEFQQGNSGRRFIFDTILGGRGPARAISADGDTTMYEPVAEFAPRPADLAEYSGEYYSPDAETTLNVVVEEGRLVAKRRPDTRIALTPVYPDAFEAQLGLIRFIRGPNGRIAELSVRQARVYDLRFSRVAN